MVNEKQKAILIENGINPDVFVELEEMLEAIDNAIVENIVNNDDEPDRAGIELQKVYDQLRKNGY